MLDLGVVRPGSTIRIPWSSFDKDDGSSITCTNYAAADILIYKDGSTTERASTAGFTATTDFDAKTGKHLAIIDLADNTTAGFFNAGSEYVVAIDAVTVDAVTTGGWIARFRIGYTGAILDTTIATLSTQTSFTLTAGPAEDDALNGMWCVIHDIASAVQLSWVLIDDYTGSTKTVTLAAGATFTAAAGDNISVMFPAPLQPTTIGRKLDVSTGGEAGLDWANVGTPGSTVSLSATTVATVTTTTTATNVTTVNGLAANVITATSIAADAITAAKIADGAIDAGAIATDALTAAKFAADCITASKIADGAIDAATFAAGAINAAAIAADAITDAKVASDVTIASVTGAVGSVTGNVGGNVTGSVGSVATGGITAASIADGAIDRATFAADTGLQTIRSNTAQAGAASTITLDASASATNDIYNDQLIYLTGGTGAGQSSWITDYVGATKVATVKPAWVTTPDNTTTFAILPAASVWHQILADHLVSGSTGAALNAAGSAGDPWNTAVPGPYGAGTAGFILGTNLDTTISSRLAPTTAGRTLDVTAGGEAGIDWANVGGQSTSVNLSGTTVNLANTVTTLTNLPAITAGWLTATGIASDAITAAKIATGAIDADALATDAVTEIWAGSTAPSAATIADAVWDEDATAHQTQGTFGQAIGDPGADTDTIFGLVNTNLDAAVSSRMATYTQPTGFLAATFPTTVASTTNITAGTITTVTNVTTVNGLAANVITAASIADGAIDRATFAADTGLQTTRSGTAQAGGASSITLDASASSVTDFYRGQLIELTGGTGAGQAEICFSYNGTTKVATMYKAWVSTAPDNTTTFAIKGYYHGVNTSLQSIADLQSIGGVAGANVTGLSSLGTAYGAGTLTTNITGNITGNLSGSVGSVTGAVGSVTGAVGSVTGNVGGNVVGSVASVTGNVGGNVTGTIGGFTSGAKAEINAEVVDCLATDTYAEPGQGTPSATLSLASKLGFIFKAWRNKTTQTATEYKLFADDTTTVDQKSTVSDDATTFTKGEIATGP